MTVFKEVEKHLPPGKKTGDPLENLKLIFSEIFPGQVGLFGGEVSLNPIQNCGGGGGGFWGRRQL